MLFKRAAQIAKAHDISLTFLFVIEKALFELPVYGENHENIETIKQTLHSQAKETGMDGIVVFVYENDTVGRAMLELEHEHHTMIITPFEENITKALLTSCNVPTLILKESQKTYEKVLVALDNTRVENYCLPFIQTLFEGSKLHLLQNEQYFFYPLTDPFISSGMIPYDTTLEMVEEEEVIGAEKSHFDLFCRQHGLEGTFKLSEFSIDEDIVAESKKHNADILVILATEDTLLDMAVKNILSLSKTDIFVCREK